MVKYIFPIILIGAAIAGFLLVTNPLYQDISLQKDQIESYNEALDNSKALEAERDKLTQQYNSFDTENLSKLEKLLPNNVDNIRLILEIEKIASPYGMVLKDVKYNTTSEDSSEQTTSTVQKKDSSNKNYGIWDLEFSTQGTYNNFISFIKEMESNLRIVDISSIEFFSNANSSIGINPSAQEVYKYNLKVKTYWLKN